MEYYVALVFVLALGQSDVSGQTRDNITRPVKPGRHVCSNMESYEKPVPHKQSFCRPVYKSYLRLCDGYRLCKAYRVIYERAYQVVYRVEMKSRRILTCCEGWAQRSPTDNGCLKPVCKKGCGENGLCVKPNKCKCGRGWTGPQCTEDLDECKAGRHGCQQVCQNTKGGYSCACHEGFTLSEDKKTCKLCLSCLPEYDHMTKGYHELMNRVHSLEKEKEVLMGNISSLQNDMHYMDEQLHHMMTVTKQPKPITQKTAPTTTTGYPYYQDPEFIPIDRLASLSEQISILEERLEDCSCNKDDEDDIPWNF